MEDPKIVQILYLLPVFHVTLRNTQLLICTIPSRES